MFSVTIRSGSAWREINVNCKKIHFILSAGWHPCIRATFCALFVHPTRQWFQAVTTSSSSFFSGLKTKAQCAQGNWPQEILHRESCCGKCIEGEVRQANPILLWEQLDKAMNSLSRNKHFLVCGEGIKWNSSCALVYVVFSIELLY